MSHYTSDRTSRFAANALVYPSGDWYGALQAEDVSSFVDVILDSHSAGPLDLSTIWWRKWRGRLGLSQEEQVALYDSRNSLLLAKPDLGKDSFQTLLKAAKAKRLEKKRQKRDDALGDAIDLTFEKDGRRRIVQGFLGETIKDVAKRHNLVDATCGGFLEVR